MEAAGVKGVHPKLAAQNVIKLQALDQFYTGFHTADNNSEGLKLIEDSKAAASATLDNKRMAFKGTKKQFHENYWKAMRTAPALKPFQEQIDTIFAAHVTTDFPLWFKTCREFRLEKQERACPTNWRQYTRTRTVNNCKKIFPLEFNVRDGLTKLGEEESLEYTTITESPDKAYNIGKYARGFRWSWEMAECDSIDGIRHAMFEFGEEARRIELKLVAEAIARDINREPLITNVPAGPMTFAKLKEAFQLTNCRDGICCKIDTIISGGGEELNIASLLGQEWINFQGGQPNVYKGLKHINEPELDLYLNGDTLLIDSRRRWLELSVMREFSGGPLLLFKDSDVRGTNRWASWDDMSFYTKALYIGGAGVLKDDCVIRVEGSGGCQ